MMRAATLLSLAGASAAALNETGYGVVNGRETNPGEWDGVLMVIGANGECGETGLCTGTLIHPRVVLSAAHCCGFSETKAVCGGKTRPGKKLGQARTKVTGSSGNNDFCMLLLEDNVQGVPIYEVLAGPVPTGDAIIVGYGINVAGSPQTGSGVQREGEVTIRTGGTGVDLSVTGRAGQLYQNACNGDSGGPIFVQQQGRWLQAGVTSRGAAGCPLASSSVYTSTSFSTNSKMIEETTRQWLGEPVLPGKCPVSQCCYDMTCSNLDPVVKLNATYTKM